MTSNNTVVSLRQPDEIDDPLTAVLRSGARRLLAQAIEAEAEAWFRKCHFQVTPEIDRALMVRGFLVSGVTLV